MTTGASQTLTNSFMQHLTGTDTTGANGYIPFQYSPAVETGTNIQQTSQPDITATINGVMQQLVGRFATPAEIKQYGAELLAAQRANPSTSTSVMTWDPKTSKMSSKTSSGTSTGVNAADFLTNLISGTANAKDYAMGTTYFDAIKQYINQSKGG